MTMAFDSGYEIKMLEKQSMVDRQFRSVDLFFSFATLGNASTMWKHSSIEWGTYRIELAEHIGQSSQG